MTYLEQPISRRNFLKASALAAAGAFINPIDVLGQSPSSTPDRSPELKPEYGFIQLGPEEIDLSLGDMSLFNSPDGHTPYLTLPDGRKRYFISSDISTYRIDTDGKSLKDAKLSGEVTLEDIREVWGPDPEAPFRRHYSGITGVFQLDKANPPLHLTGITHNENRGLNAGASGAFQATVGLIESFDGGDTWEDRGEIIQGVSLTTPGESVSGAGQPNAIQIGEHLYIYYVDWSGPHQIYLARAGINGQGTIDTELEFYNDKGFVKNDKTDLKSVIPVPDDDFATYSALPSISWNIALNKFLCVFETGIGFFQTTSEDGISWEKPKLIANFPQRHSERQKEDVWYSYPTLASEDGFEDDHTTGKTGTLYYSSGEWGYRHHLVARDFEII